MGWDLGQNERISSRADAELEGLQMSTIKDRLKALYAYAREQLTETSTLRGILVLAALGGGWIAKVPTDAALSVAVVLGAALKVVLPDRL
jgi:hypothetical protein